MTTLSSGQRAAATRAGNRATNFFDDRDGFIVRSIAEHVYPILLEIDTKFQVHAWLRDWIVSVSQQGRFFQEVSFASSGSTAQIAAYVRDKQSFLEFTKYAGSKTLVNNKGNTVSVDGVKPNGKSKWRYISKNSRIFLFRSAIIYMKKMNIASFSEGVKSVLEWAKETNFISYGHKYEFWYEETMKLCFTDEQVRALERALGDIEGDIGALHELYISKCAQTKADYFLSLMKLYEDFLHEGLISEEKHVDGFHFILLDFFRKNGYEVITETTGGGDADVGETTGGGDADVGETTGGGDADVGDIAGDASPISHADDLSLFECVQGDCDCPELNNLPPMSSPAQIDLGPFDDKDKHEDIHEPLSHSDKGVVVDDNHIFTFLDNIFTKPESPMQMTTKRPLEGDEDADVGETTGDGDADVGDIAGDASPISHADDLSLFECVQGDCDCPELNNLPPMSPPAQIGLGPFDDKDKHEDIHEPLSHSDKGVVVDDNHIFTFLDNIFTKPESPMQMTTKRPLEGDEDADVGETTGDGDADVGDIAGDASPISHADDLSLFDMCMSPITSPVQGDCDCPELFNLPPMSPPAQIGLGPFYDKDKHEDIPEPLSHSEKGVVVDDNDISTFLDDIFTKHESPMQMTTKRPLEDTNNFHSAKKRHV